MALFKNFAAGIDSYGDAHKFIIKHNLWGYVLFPGIINLVLFILVFLLGYYTGSYVVERIFEWYGISGESEGFFRILLSALHFFIKIFVYLILFMVYLTTYKYIVLIIMTPLLAVLSDKTSKLITGDKVPYTFGLLMKDVFRGTALVFRNIFIELFYIILCFIIGFIPFAGILVPVFLFILSMYFYGFSMMYYSHQCYRLKIKQSVQFIRRNKGFAIANGFIFYLLLMIPLLGLLVAPSYAVVAATIGVEKLKK
jgi:CysZ protein